MEFTVSNIEKLAELLRPPEPDVLQGDDLHLTDYEITSSRGNKKPETLKDQKLPRTIEEYELQQAEEVEQMGKTGLGAEDCKAPAFTMNYQQSVSAEDVFLQMGPKTPSSASCENLIVKIAMPGDKKENIDLSVDTNSVTIHSSRYYLKLPLPHEINPDTSKANWDSAEESLVLTLKLNREFDFINF
ncbi:dynein axonemal assembly factor 6 [Melitaea cinxia]|uniref:dynein axonemal assembly factor 6 n=1 Tax=Melitaea cinxia TaxID=113334 RepID=UPI001E270F01|nr:dynein axonemal assembly factor 6 [Melitaea cinxia]